MLQDHLHIRGEHHQLKIIPYLNLGSSPHTWRTPNHHDQAISPIRIISTYVENTRQRTVNPPLKGDHLHIRGEHKGGSYRLWELFRIISTYVENTGIFRKAFDPVKDHLHIRGEHEFGSELDNLSIGSSPHT